MILFKKIRIIFLNKRYSIYNMNVGKRFLRKIKKPNERLFGSIFFCSSHNKLITFISLFKYKNNKVLTNITKDSNEDKDEDINLYLFTKVFNNRNNIVY